MRIRFLLATINLIILVILSGCSPDFNTDFDPPKPDAKLTDIFPDEIDEMIGQLVSFNIEQCKENKNCDKLVSIYSSLSTSRAS